MRCPFCDAEKERLKVIDSRTAEGGRAIRRRRQCLNCNKRFTTYERIEENVRLTVIKKDGRRMPWDRSKILTGLQRACFKRRVPESEILPIAHEGEGETFRHFDREGPRTLIGATVAGQLPRRRPGLPPGPGPRALPRPGRRHRAGPTSGDPAPPRGVYPKAPAVVRPITCGEAHDDPRRSTPPTAADSHPRRALRGGRRRHVC